MKPLFLRWAVVHVAATCGLVALALGGYASGLHGAPLVATLVILLVATGASLYCGLLSWRADGVPAGYGPRGLRHADREVRHAVILHDASHIFYAVAVLQILGLVGAMLGYREETHSAALPDAGAAIKHLTLGLGNGLTATLVGVMCSLVIWLEHHVLAHDLERGRA